MLNQWCLPVPKELSKGFVSPGGGAVLFVEGRVVAFCGGLDLVAHDGDPLDDALAFEVVEDVVLGATIVPHGDRACCPVVSNGETIFCCMAGEIGEERFALVMAHFDDTSGEVVIHEERLSARDGMRADDRVNGLSIGGVVRACVVQRAESLAEVFEGLRKRVVGAVHIRPERVAAEFGALFHVENRVGRGLGFTC